MRILITGVMLTLGTTASAWTSRISDFEKETNTNCRVLGSQTACTMDGSYWAADTYHTCKSNELPQTSESNMMGQYLVYTKESSSRKKGKLSYKFCQHGIERETREDFISLVFRWNYKCANQKIPSESTPTETGSL